MEAPAAGRARWQPLLVAAVTLAGAAGCGGTGTVSGKVSYRGRPVVVGSVIILSADNTARSGVIEADGTYVVKQVRPGPVRIGVTSRDPTKSRTSGEKPKPGEKKKPDKSWFPLPRRLEDPTTSGLTATVTAGMVRHDIEIQ